MPELLLRVPEELSRDVRDLPEMEESLGEFIGDISI